MKHLQRALTGIVDVVRSICEAVTRPTAEDLARCCPEATQFVTRSDKGWGR